MNFGKNSINKIKNLLMPLPSTGGLSVADSAIRFIEIKNGKEISSLFRLPPGAIEGGRVKDKQELIGALKKLHQQIYPDPRRIINVILTIPVSNTYNQAFTVSRYAETGLAEAAELNLRMLSPIDVGNSYYGWQKIGENSAEGGQIELLGAVVLKDIVDELSLILREAGFGVAAVEFCSLSLARNINSLGILDKKLSYLAVEVNAEGVDFMVLKNNNLYFDYFYPWNLIQDEERKISEGKLKAAIETEANKILSFYFTHWGESIKNLILITPILGNEIAAAVCEKCNVCENEILNPNQVSSEKGAALRGLSPRTSDFEISLTNISASGVFGQEQIIYFIAIWRNILLLIFGFLLLLFTATDLYIRQSAVKAAEIASVSVKQPENTELIELQRKAEEFNKLVIFVKKARETNPVIYPLFNKLNELAGSRVSFKRIYFQAVNLPSAISASTANEENAFEFKKKMESIPQFAEIDMPLSSIIAESDGRIGFTVNFVVNGLDFGPSSPLSSQVISSNEPSLVNAPKQPEEKNWPVAATQTAESQKILEKGLENITKELNASSPESAGPLIIFKKINYKSNLELVKVETSALNRDIMLMFKNKLSESPNFSKVQIIESTVVGTSDGRISFTIEFFIKI